MPFRKLTPELVREARRRAAAGETLEQIVEHMPVQLDATYKAITGITWARVDDPAPVDIGRDNNRKLTAAMVREARRRVAAGESVAGILDDYPVAHGGLNAAVRGHTWKHITDPPPVPAEDPNNIPTATRSETGDQLVANAMPPPGATPCHRCHLLCVGRYCRYCYDEGHAPSWSRPETSHPGTRRYADLVANEPPYMGRVGQDAFLSGRR